MNKRWLAQVYHNIQWEQYLNSSTALTVSPQRDLLRLRTDSASPDLHYSFILVYLASFSFLNPLQTASDPTGNPLCWTVSASQTT
jgi:hypothetical protein